MPADPKNSESWSGENKLAVVIETAALNEAALASNLGVGGLGAAVRIPLAVRRYGAPYLKQASPVSGDNPEANQVISAR